MLKVKTEVLNLKGLENHIQYVNKMLKMKTDKNFQKFIQDKCLQTVEKVARQRLGGTTNDEYIEEYILRNKIREDGNNGFILYNDFTIPAILSTKNTINQNRDNGLVRNYDKGFNIALAFEYGVGIVGANNPVQNSWAYNINNYGEYGWYYKTISGESVRTTGYQGAEVYRYTAIEIQKNLKSWVNEYYKKEV